MISKIKCFKTAKNKTFLHKNIKVQKRVKVAPQEKNQRVGCRFKLIFLSFLAFRADLPAQLVYLTLVLHSRNFTNTNLYQLKIDK